MIKKYSISDNNQSNKSLIVKRISVRYARIFYQGAFQIEIRSLKQKKTPKKERKKCIKD